MNKDALKIEYAALKRDINFNNVHAAMEAVGWTWHGQGVPSVVEIESFLNRIVDDALELRKADNDSEPIYLESGGFRIEIKGNHLWIGFVLEQADNNP